MFKGVFRIVNADDNTEISRCIAVYDLFG